MTKDEMKNKISMALKDPILQQGFECICKENTELEKENAELKEVHESDKRSLALIAKKGADFEKAYNEAEELLDKQIEATYKLFEENKKLKAYNEKLLDGDIEKHNKIVELEEENSRLKQIILGNEMEIAAKDETIEELNKLFR